MKKLLLIASIVVGAPAHAKEVKPYSCKAAISGLASLMTSEAPEEIIKDTVSQMLGKDFDSSKSHKIYLDTMRRLHFIRGAERLHFPDKDEREWVNFAKSTMCEGEEKYWPHD